MASAVKSLDWMQDGVNDTESEALEDLLYIVVDSLSVASSVVALAWVQDSIDVDEAQTIGWLNNMSNPEVAAEVVALDWIGDGINATETTAIQEISYIDYSSGDVALAVVALPWVQDGIDEIEGQAISWIQNVGSPEVAAEVVALDWVEDGVEAIEVAAIELISYIDYRSTEALAITRMPFLETVEPPDIAAMESLRLLAAFREDVFARVMAHPTVREGITDDTAARVAVLNGVAKTNPSLLDAMLAPGSVETERRVISLPLGGEVILVILRTSPGPAISMDLLEAAVRGSEEYMDAPFPSKFVAVLFEDAVTSTAAGTNFGTHIAILPKYDADDDSHEASGAGNIIAHEVAHYYWSGNADWVDEGAADFVASVVESARTGKPVGVTNEPCGYARDIAELEALDAARGDPAFWCNYALGERLFVDLYRTLGAETFRQAFRGLYLASEEEDADDDSDGTALGVEHVSAAFSGAAGVEETIARWYEETGDYDLSDLDTSPVDARLPEIGWQLDEAYVATSKNGPPVDVVSAQDVTGWLRLVLKYSYDVSSTVEIPFEVVEFYEDGFEFSRDSDMLTVEEEYIGGTWRWSVGVSPSRKWATGSYWVYVYADGQKVAEVQYEVIP